MQGRAGQSRKGQGRAGRAAKNRKPAGSGASRLQGKAEQHQSTGRARHGAGTVFMAGEVGLHTSRPVGIGSEGLSATHPQ